MSKLPLLTSDTVISVFKLSGFTFDRLKGSHQIFINQDTGKRVVVPVHPGRDIPKGTLMEVIRQAGISREDLDIFLRDGKIR